MKFNWKIKNFLLILVLLGLTFSLSNKSVKAESTTTPADFSVQPILPSDNIGGQRMGYFNLPDSQKKRMLQVKIFNNSDFPLEVQAKMANASTLTNGVVSYDSKYQPDAKLLGNPGTNYLSANSEINIAAKSSATFTITVKPFDFKGMKAAAINFIGTPANQSSAIQNQYVYTVGIVLNGKNLTDQEIKKTRVQSISLAKKAKEIKIELANPAAAYLMNEEVNAKLSSAQDLFFSYQKKRDNLKIAPSSKYNFTIPLKGEKLVSGAYKLQLQEKNDLYQQTIYKYVEVTPTKVRLITKQQYDFIRIRIYLIIGSLILVLIIGVIIWRKRRKKNEELISKN